MHSFADSLARVLRNHVLVNDVAPFIHWSSSIMRKREGGIDQFGCADPICISLFVKWRPREPDSCKIRPLSQRGLTYSSALEWRLEQDKPVVCLKLETMGQPESHGLSSSLMSMYHGVYLDWAWGRDSEIVNRHSVTRESRHEIEAQASGAK